MDMTLEIGTTGRFLQSWGNTGQLSLNLYRWQRQSGLTPMDICIFCKGFEHICDISVEISPASSSLFGYSSNLVLKPERILCLKRKWCEAECCEIVEFDMDLVWEGYFSFSTKLESRESWLKKMNLQPVSGEIDCLGEELTWSRGGWWCCAWSRSPSRRSCTRPRTAQTSGGQSDF